MGCSADSKIELKAASLKFKPLIRRIQVRPKGAERMEKIEVLRHSRENLEWFRDNYADLEKDFDKQWVVVQDKSVIANCSTYDEVLRKIRGGRSKKTALVEFIDSEQIAMFF
jgi:hypothetical protein